MIITQEYRKRWPFSRADELNITTYIDFLNRFLYQKSQSYDISRVSC